MPLLSSDDKGDHIGFCLFGAEAELAGFGVQGGIDGQGSGSALKTIGSLSGSKAVAVKIMTSLTPVHGCRLPSIVVPDWAVWWQLALAATVGVGEGTTVAVAVAERAWRLPLSG